MEECANRIKNKSLAYISGVIEGLADKLEWDNSAETCADVATKLRDITQELFNRDLDSQESYLEHDHKQCDQMLARMDND